jgi:glycosyltransferase involved in cell wall biosynthesis
VRIAFLCTSGLDYPSPRGRWLPVAHELARAGHQPTLLMLHPTWDRLTHRTAQRSGVALRYVQQMHIYGHPGARRAYSPSQLLLVSARAALALAAGALQARAERLIVAKPQPINGLAGLLAARLLGRPLLVDCDDYEAGANRFSAGWQRRMVTLWEDRLPPAAAGVTVNTRMLERRVAALGVSPERLRYVPNGLADDQYEGPEPARVRGLRAALGLDSRPTLLYLGAVSSVAHGVGLLLDAFALALRRVPEARLLVVGDGDDRPDLQRHAAQLGLGGAVIWAGHVPPAATRAYFALADASCDPVADTPAMAARSPLKIVESLAQGVPVLTGDVGDRREMLGGGAGLIVAPGDPHALADGIIAALTDPAQRARWSAEARARAQHYRWGALAAPWVDLVERAAR